MSTWKLYLSLELSDNILAESTNFEISKIQIASKTWGIDTVTEGAIRLRTEEVRDRFLNILIFGNCVGEESIVKNF